LLAFVALGPLTNLLSASLSRNNLGSKLASDFDYTIITEIMRHHDVAFELSLALMASFLVLYLPWAVFCQGGFMAMIRQYPNKAPMTDFWRGGAYYFFRYLRLAVYIIALSGIILQVFQKFLLNGFSPFKLDSEGPMITKFWLLLIAFIGISILLHTIKTLSKNLIADEDHWNIGNANLKAIKLLSARTIALQFINILVILFFAGLYFLLRKLLGSYLIPAILLGQLFLLFRMASKYVGLASFHHYLEDPSDQV